MLALVVSTDVIVNRQSLWFSPTLATDNFKVEFEVNIVIVLTTGDLITENFPIKLIRN